MKKNRPAIKLEVIIDKKNKKERVLILNPSF